MLHGYTEPYWLADMSAASMCIDVLNYCGDADPLASRFNRIVQGYRDILEAKSREDKMSTDGPPPDIFDHEIPAECLFVSPPGNSDLHPVSRDLLHLIQRPFQDPRLWSPGGSALEPVIRETLINAEENMIGTHLEWTCEISHYFREHDIDDSTTRTSDNISTFEMLSRLGSSQFDQSGEPSGWTASASTAL